MIEGKVLEQIVQNARKIADDCDCSAESNFILGKHWDMWNLVLGLSAAVLSALAAGAIDKIKVFMPALDSNGIASVASIVSLIAALCASVLTFLKPSEKASVYRDFGNKYRALRNRTRVYTSIDCLTIVEYEKLRAKLDVLLKEKEDLNLDNPVIHGWAFRRAKEAIDQKDREKKAKQKRDRDEVEPVLSRVPRSLADGDQRAW